MTTVTVMGISGMLGSTVHDYLSHRDLEVRGTARGQREADGIQALDVTTADEGDLQRAIEGSEWVVNCIGAVKQRIDESDPHSTGWAIDVNAAFPHRLARVAEQVGARVIQIATDCVYSGSRGAYVESDPHDPLDAYGKSKSLGEVRSEAFRHLRCSVVGPETGAAVSLLGWFLSQPPGCQVTGFTDHRWNGVTSLQFAQLCDAIVTEEVPDFGLLHVVPRDDVSKCDLLRSFALHFDRGDIEIKEAPSGQPLDRTLATEQAEINESLWASAGFPAPPSVDEMVEQLASYVGT
jgi:dTDP-4-dehydrorhamnose reductase